ncbi:membrane protein insertion efficiency factor YidD [Hyphomonas sp. WL0036]|uniref:membrane protein insertion efficiency factor YidD n=1 Tax=Hyphomonas sediminis TaxID=2866160 RepID=UPI001C7FDBCC|nr:membrane protein insertion efficiency factor YidD [Hyphomonas sediminis]MBY9065430.1 membrane protein insertion efficiency factor YidD [Hyphomonas sediminis]
MRQTLPSTADIELDVPETLRPSAMRRLGLTPELDQRIDALRPPATPWWRQLAVSLLRTYRRIRPGKIGNRCVFEPSCSRYSELAFRTRSFPTAIRLTLSRLHRCSPRQGGIDLKDLEIPE